MKRRYFYLLAGAIALGTISLQAGNMEMQPITGSADLEAIKKLAGSWVGTMNLQEGADPVTVDYRVTSNGSAVEEVIGRGTPHEMVSVYHDENGKLTMTHYCAIGNAPRMDLQKSSNGVYEFKFDKKHNAIDPKTPHMNGLVLTVRPDGTLKHQWSAVNCGDGKPTEFDLKRKS